MELQRHPEQVEATSTLVRLLTNLLDALDGAVAIISGRSVANLEAQYHLPSVDQALDCLHTIPPAIGTAGRD